MNRSQKPEVRSQKPEVRSQKSEVCLLSSVLCPLVFCFLLLILISCTGMKIEKEEVSEGTLIIYLYLPNSNQQDINFTIEKIEIKQRDGGWIKLSEKPFVIRSLDIAKDQIGRA